MSKDLKAQWCLVCRKHGILARGLLRDHAVFRGMEHRLMDQCEDKVYVEWEGEEE